MSQMLERYRELAKQLDVLIARDGKECSDEQDKMMSEMDTVWYSLSKDEVDLINKELGR